LDNIEDPILFETRTREYNPVPYSLKGRYDHQDSVMEMQIHGLMLNQQLPMEISFSQCVAALGRPVVVGDMIELPTEVMYDASMRPVRKFMEVTDVAWSSTSYTPGWQPLFLRVMLQPAIASKETRDVMGPLTSNQFDVSGLFDVDDGLATQKTYQDYSEITQAVRAEAHNENPEDGTDLSLQGTPKLADVVRVLTPELGEEVALRVAQAVQKPQRGGYVEDAMPPNGEPFTSGSTLPEGSHPDGTYHRLVYTGSASDIPARLYRYSAAKRRWIYMETDKRALIQHVNSRNNRLTRDAQGDS
jgi:hypothetical protein